MKPTDTATSTPTSLSIYWEVDGHRLPPEPDPAANNATLHGIDSNHDGVRDDVERYIYGRVYPKYLKTNRALALQFAKSYLKIIDHPTFDKHTLIDKALACQEYFTQKHTRGKNFHAYLSWQKQNILGTGYQLEDVVFNTRKRIIQRFVFAQWLNGHFFDPIWVTKSACETDIDALGE